MKRRGQIFLILTILVITFLVGISSVLLDIQRANYLDPAPGTSVTYEAWETTISSIEQSMEIQLSINTTNGDSSGSVNMTDPLNRIEQYLFDRGFSASIENTSNIEYENLTPSPENNTVRIFSSFHIVISSASTDISQNVNLEVKYAAFESIAGSQVTVVKNIDGRTFVDDAAFSPSASVTNNFDGSYSVASTTSYTITTPSNIELSITTS